MSPHDDTARRSKREKPGRQLVWYIDSRRSSSREWLSACSRLGRTTIPNESEASHPLDPAHRISSKAPHRVELLGVSQGEKGVFNLELPIMLYAIMQA